MNEPSIIITVLIVLFIVQLFVGHFHEFNEQETLLKYIKDKKKYDKYGTPYFPEGATTLFPLHKQLKKQFTKDLADIDRLNIRPETKEQMRKIIEDMLNDIVNRQEFIDMVNNLTRWQYTMFAKHPETDPWPGETREKQNRLYTTAQNQYDKFRTEIIPDYIENAILQNDEYKSFVDRLNKELPELTPHEVGEIQKKYVNTIKTRLRMMVEKLHQQTTYNEKSWEKAISTIE